MNEKEVKITS